MTVFKSFVYLGMAIAFAVASFSASNAMIELGTSFDDDVRKHKNDPWLIATPAIILSCILMVLMVLDLFF